MFTEEIKKSLSKVLREMGVSDIDISLEHPAEMKNGDYSTNIALKLKTQNSNLKTTSQNSNLNDPKEFAEFIISKWQNLGLPEFVEKIEVAGPGFLNIWLNFEAYSGQLIAVLRKGEDYGRRLKPAITPDESVIAGFSPRQKTMVIDYSAPNIAKPFGIGHLRSTNIGQAIYNLYQFLGWKVIGDNHLGDWGTQFGKLIYQIECKVQSAKCKVSKEEFLKNLTIEELEKMYVEFHKEAETKPEMEESARMCFKKLEEGNKEATEIWQACVDISLKEFDRIYKLLGVKIDFAYGESFYLDKMEAVLADCRQKKILRDSEGAKVVEIPGMELPAMLVKSDGATTYFLRDLAAVKFRNETWKPDLIVYEVGADQSLHFRQLFKVCEMLGYGQLSKFVHIAHGLIRWAEGKFSTRKGMTIHLEEVLDESIKRATAFVPPSGTSASQRKKIAQVVGIGAIKYNDLKQNPRTDIIFDWDQILTLQGNSGSYLQYTYARTQSVLRKVVIPTKRAEGECVEESLSPVTGKGSLDSARDDLSNEEIILLRTIYKFSEVIEKAAGEFSPNLLCNFLFDLAQKFNLFYDKHRILKSKIKNQKSNPNVKTQSEDEVIEEQSNFRLALTAGVGQVLKNGLTLLGIETLQKM